MKGFILASWFGECLRHIAFTFHKSLVPVSGIHLIVNSLYLLFEAGVTDIISNLHFPVEEFDASNSRRFDFSVNTHSNDGKTNSIPIKSLSKGKLAVVQNDSTSTALYL